MFRMKSNQEGLIADLSRNAKNTVLVRKNKTARMKKAIMDKSHSDDQAKLLLAACDAADNSLDEIINQPT